MEGNFRTVILQEVGSLGFGTSRDPLGDKLDSPREGGTPSSGTEGGKCDNADWAPSLAGLGGSSYNWHFNSLWELEYRGRWMKLHGQKGNKFLVL